MVAPIGIAQLFEHELEHLEVVVLLVADDVDHVVELVVLETAERGAEVLRHIYGGAVAAQQQFLVEPVGREVDPHRIVVATVEDAFLEPLLDERLAQQISLRLVVDLVEIDAQRLVSDVETLVDPTVHGLPQRIDFGVLGLPLAQHLLRFEHDRRLLLGFVFRQTLRHKLLDLSLVVLVELDVIFTDEVVALHARRRGRLAVAVELPGQHRLADMDAAVVDQIGLDDLMTVGGENLRDGISQEVIADMPQVQGLVGIGRRIFDHDRAARRSGLPELGVGGDLGETRRPERTAERKVQKTLDDVERLDFGDVGREPLTYLGSRGFGRLAASSQQGKHDEGIVALELPAGLLNLQRLALRRPVERFRRPADRLRKKGLDIHGWMEFRLQI